MNVVQNPFLIGVLEGFYGRAWSLDQRLAYADYLPALGCNAYIYAPKSDSYLRKRWQQPWPSQQRNELAQLAARYRQRGLQWGVGLSPFALYQNYGPEQRLQLHQKVDEIRALSPSILAILFDDMPGDLVSLAQRQAEIVGDIQHWAPQQRLLVCPTYYSYDPVLEKFFGDMPAEYWSQLGDNLAAEIDVFWTGNRVCSESICSADLQAISQQLNRPLVLWDNYPVNDGAQRSQHLYLQPLAQREFDSEPDRESVVGHFCNPMNQALLSLPALRGLAQVHGVEVAGEDWLAQKLGRGTWALLQRDGAEFEAGGLSAMNPQRREQLAREYQALGDPAALEVAGWLRGEYAFDPACLTD